MKTLTLPSKKKKCIFLFHFAATDPFKCYTSGLWSVKLHDVASSCVFVSAAKHEESSEVSSLFLLEEEYSPWPSPQSVCLHAHKYSTISLNSPVFQFLTEVMADFLNKAFYQIVAQHIPIKPRGVCWHYSGSGSNRCTRIQHIWKNEVLQQFCSSEGATSETIPLQKG